MRRFLSDFETRYLEWWGKSTPLELIELEIKTLEYQIKVKELESLGKEAPSMSFTYAILNIHKQWQKDKQAEIERENEQVENLENS